MKRLLLVGGGHAHALVLERIARERAAGWAVCVVSPGPWQYYSGMLPGWIEGIYRDEDCRIDLRRVAAAAGAEFLFGSAAGLDPQQRVLRLMDGRSVEFDVASLAVGGEPNVGWLAQLGQRLVPIKPFADFATAWRRIRADAEHGPFRLAIVGGGAAGVEVALAARAGLPADAGIELVTGLHGLLPGHSAYVRRHANAALARAAVACRPGRAAGTEDGLLLPDATRIAADRVVAATGARAPQWLREGGLALDEEGFVLVDPMHRSLSHPHVFAAGDVCSRPGSGLARSGVHAVHAGRTLGVNLLAQMGVGSLRPYRPRKAVLYLLATGGRTAIASFGPLGAEGAWAWRWKDHIDRRFIRRFQAPASAVQAQRRATRP